MKIRNTYLLFITIIGLVSLAMYTTYALFTASVDVGEFVNLTASSLPTDTSVVEYERLTLQAGESKIIDLNITNNTSDSLYYGVWYEMIEPSSINNDIVIAKLDTSVSNTIGHLTSNTSNVVTLIIENNTTDTLVINIGVGYSKTSSLNLPTTRNIITEVASQITNLDESGANTPDLIEGLIPVMYNGSNWVKADSTNSNEEYKWYDYTNKQWANAVLVSSTNRSIYQSANPGTTVSESDILAYYVWIPRYKYKVWNINKVIGTDTYNVQTTGIDIEFELEKETTGTIKCTSYSFVESTSSKRNETCSGSDGDYYTHPAFWWDNDGDGTREENEELRGIWVGKFEVSNSTSQIKIKPNVESLRLTAVSDFSSAIQNMQRSGNSYGLTTDKIKVDSHMIKNMEWGAVAYLTHSDYGRCSNNVCSEVTINSNSSYYTGGNNYISNIAQSTTENIYGIYDMNGGSREYVMGNMSKVDRQYTYYQQEAGTKFSYSITTAKYIDTYAIGNSFGDQAAYNRARLGDATGEIVLSSGSSSWSAGLSWYEDIAMFVDTSYPWFDRGGTSSSGTGGGVFNFSQSSGPYSNVTSTRVVLIAL